MLAGSLCLLPFLLPYHQPPILSFFPEWLAAALGVAAALALLVGRGVTAVFLPAPARWLIAFAVLLAAQAASGGHAYSQLPLFAALYVLYAVLMIWLGAQLTAALGIERVAMVLAAFFLAGALANSLAGVIQFYGRPKLLEDVIAELHGRRAYGNIAQANLYANYLALGEGALLFLWVRARVRTAYALPALALLLMGSSLSGSRGALLYALWYGALGLLAVRVQDGEGARRLKFAACGVAVAALSAHFAVPWLNDLLHLGPPGEGMLDRILASPEHPEPRRQAWLIALRVFIGAPLAGVGIGEFAGAAFELGLDPSLTQIGEVWTSPHNLPLHLLAETGLVGTVLVLGGLCVWGWQAARRYWTDRQVASWWIITAVGIEMIHSLTEFPLWSAHFLGVTALLVGVSAGPGRSLAVARASGIGAGAVCAVLSVVLAIMLRDYMRLDVTRITGTTVTLTAAAQAHDDAETMRELTHGLMAPLAELWIVIGAPLDRSNLADKLAMSERVARYWPANAVVTRRAVFLAFQGEAAKARESLAPVLRTFPHRRDATILMLEQARQADPDAIAPLMAMA
ncbi:MAG TPA: Wzy polymerase domain-containing protein, partial [Ktedonobacterales bacterium]|nr:Wzy polymerase domain-containing protein [Ktedonobacterales bacterium]